MSNEIVFARTRWDYASYVDYWALVELSGFPIVWLDEMDLSKLGTTYIVSPMNGEFVPYMEQNKGRVSEVLLWNLERPSGSNSLSGYIAGNRQYIKAGHLDGVIVSDLQLSKDTGFKHVPLGSHHKLGTPGEMYVRILGYDLIHLSCYSNNRSFLFRTPEDPKDELYGLKIARNSWGEERHKYLSETRFMLNVHQDVFPYMEPLRFSLAAAYGLPIISERCYDIWPYAERWVRMGAIDEILNSDWVRDKALFGKTGYLMGLEMCRTMTTHYSFRACLERFL